MHVHGISYRTRDTQDNLAARVQALKEDALNIGAPPRQCWWQPRARSYAPCSLGDLDAAGMDYWALGHIHQQQFLREGGPWIAYPGDTQGRSPKPERDRTKGRAGRRRVGRVLIDRSPSAGGCWCASCLRYRHRRGRLDAGCCRLSSIEHDRRTARKSTPGAPWSCASSLEGRGPIGSDLHREGTVADLCTKSCVPPTRACRPFVWIESLRDRSRSDSILRLWESAGSSAPSCLVLADGLREDPDARRTFVAGAAGLLDKPGQVRQSLQALESEEADEILDEALELALDGLEREEDA